MAFRIRNRSSEIQVIFLQGEKIEIEPDKLSEVLADRFRSEFELNEYPWAVIEPEKEIKLESIGPIKIEKPIKKRGRKAKPKT